MIKQIKSIWPPLLLMLIPIIIFGFFLLDSPKSVDSEPTGEMIGKIDNFTSFKLEGWGAAWYTQPEYDGDDMPADGLVEATNIDLDIKKSIAPRLGNDLLGTESSNVNPIITLHTSKALDGRELLLRTYETVIEWWNVDDESWDTLDAGYTSGKLFSFADGMTSDETSNYTYFTNGNESLRRFRVAFGSLATTTGATTTLNSVTGYDSADDIGFNTSGSVTINGADYSYTGINGWILTGMTGVPTTLSANEGIISAVETTGFTDAPASSTALAIKDQRLYASYNNSVFCSKIDDFRDFSFSSPRVASEGEVVIFPEGGGKITALAVRPNYVAVFKKDYIGSLKFEDFSSDLSDIPVIDTISVGVDIGAVSPNSVISKNFSVIFSNYDIGISELTRLESRDYDQSVSLSERIRNSVGGYVLDDAAIGIYKNKVLLAARDDSDFNNKIIVYDFLYDRFTEFTGWNANSFAVYNDNLYYGDSVSQNVYKAFVQNGYEDSDLPYTTSWKTKWINFGYPDSWKEIERIYVEGFINQNTTITFTVNMDEGGEFVTKDYTITGSGDYVSAFTDEGFGTNPFGLTNFSNIEGDSDNLLHFSGFILTDDLFSNKFRNIQFAGVTSGTGQNYRISKIIPYINLLEPNYCIDFSDCVIND